MKAGVIADTHDNLRAVRYLVDFFNNVGVDCIIHAGDFISPFVIPELQNFSGPVIGVFGNNDGDRETLLNKAENSAVEIHPAPHQFKLGDRKILLVHRPRDIPAELPNDVEVVISGHTHESKNKKDDKCLYINPGEAGGWLTATTHSVILNLEDLTMEMYMVPAP